MLDPQIRRQLAEYWPNCAASCATSRFTSVCTAGPHSLGAVSSVDQSFTFREIRTFSGLICRRNSSQCAVQAVQAVPPRGAAETRLSVKGRILKAVGFPQLCFIFNRQTKPRVGFNWCRSSWRAWGLSSNFVHILVVAIWRVWEELVWLFGCSSN